MEFASTIFWSLFEDTTIPTKFLKSHICNTPCIEINTLFAIFNNKELGNFKVSWLMESLSKYKCYEDGYAELAFPKK